MPFRAEGSSYILRQLPGSERMGGLTVTLYPRQDRLGTLRIELSEYQTGDPIESPEEVETFAQAAEKGLREFALERNIELTSFDIRIHKFLYHPTDSDPHAYKQAGRSAFRAALEVLLRREL